MSELSRRAADNLGIAIALSLPWSTSLTAIFVAVWMVVVLPSLRLPRLADTLRGSAASTPLALWLIALLGMLWASGPWSEALHGMRGFHKLLLIPLFLHHFRSSERVPAIVTAFGISVGGLLAASWVSYVWPDFVWNHKPSGVPVKDWIYQGLFFVLAICGLAYLAARLAGERRWLVAALCVLGIGLFAANMAWVMLSRTAIVTLAVLGVLIGWQLRGLKGAAGAAVGMLALGAVAWAAAPQVQNRVGQLIHGVMQYGTGTTTSETERLVFWRKSVRFIGEAPLIGHGTGSIERVFARSVAGETGPGAIVSRNPHNQVFFVGIQLGLLGIGLLLAMWVCHLRLFAGTGWAHRLGQLVVLQNVVMCLFNSSISDFTSGWVYVFGVGVLGGAVLRTSAPLAAAEPSGLRP